MQEHTQPGARHMQQWAAHNDLPQYRPTIAPTPPHAAPPVIQTTTAPAAATSQGRAIGARHIALIVGILFVVAVLQSPALLAMAIIATPVAVLGWAALRHSNANKPRPTYIDNTLLAGDAADEIAEWDRRNRASGLLADYHQQEAATVAAANAEVADWHATVQGGVATGAQAPADADITHNPGQRATAANATANVLRATLGDSWHVLHDTLGCDHIIVGPGGLWAVNNEVVNSFRESAGNFNSLKRAHKTLAARYPRLPVTRLVVADDDSDGYTQFAGVQRVLRSDVGAHILSAPAVLMVTDAQRIAYEIAAPHLVQQQHLPR